MEYDAKKSIDGAITRSVNALIESRRVARAGFRVLEKFREIADLIPLGTSFQVAPDVPEAMAVVTVFVFMPFATAESQAFMEAVCRLFPWRRKQAYSVMQGVPQYVPTLFLSSPDPETRDPRLPRAPRPSIQVRFLGILCPPGTEPDAKGASPSWGTCRPCMEAAQSQTGDLAAFLQWQSPSPAIVTPLNSPAK